MAATDLLSLIVEARTAVNLTTAAHDVELQLFLTGISTRIDALCGPVVARAVTGERHDGGVRYVVPRRAPLYSVTTLTEYTSGAATALTAETLTSLLSNMYLLDTSVKLYPRIWRRESGSDSAFPTGRQNVALTYSAGRVAATANVPENFKLAAASILRRVWKRETSTWAQQPAYTSDEGGSGRAEGFYRAVDPMVREFLADELLPPGMG